MKRYERYILNGVAFLGIAMATLLAGGMVVAVAIINIFH